MMYRYGSSVADNNYNHRELYIKLGMPLCVCAHEVYLALVHADGSRRKRSRVISSVRVGKFA